MKKNGKLKVILIVLIVLFLVSGILLIYKKMFSTKSFYDLEPTYILKPCLGSGCDVPSEIKYNTISISYKIKSINDVIDKINNDTFNYYETDKKSSLDSQECVSAISTYKYRNITSTNYFNYENNKYISIAVARVHHDLCLKTFYTDPVEVYIYSKAKKEIVKPSYLMSNEKISENDVYLAIKKSLKSYGKEIDRELVFQDKYEYSLYYNYDGDLLVNFEIPEEHIYYSAIVKRNSN